MIRTFPGPIVRLTFELENSRGNHPVYALLLLVQFIKVTHLTQTFETRKHTSQRFRVTWSIYVYFIYGYSLCLYRFVTLACQGGEIICNETKKVKVLFHIKVLTLCFVEFKSIICTLGCPKNSFLRKKSPWPTSRRVRKYFRFFNFVHPPIQQL